MYEKLKRIKLPNEILMESFEIFRYYGDLNHEVSIIWVGKRENNNFIIEDVWLPDQECTMISFYIPSHETHNISKELYNKNLELIAQLHTHPTNAFHSPIDDRGSMLLFNGQLSIVIPNFGDIEMINTDNWRVYRQFESDWGLLQSKEVKKLFQII